MQVIHAGCLIDGTGGQPRSDICLFIENRKIVDIVEAQASTNLEDAIYYDATEYTIMPGMIDAHVHVMYNGNPRDRLNQKEGLISELTGMATLKSYINAKKDLDAGFTTIRDMASRDFIDISLRDAINNQLVVGPNIAACGYGLTSTGGHMDYHKGLRPDVQLGYFNNVVDTPEQARKAVRYLVMMGADHIKINLASCYRMQGRPLIHAQEMRNDVISAIVEEAHILGRKVGAHCNGIDEVFAVQSGLDSIEHGHFIDDETLRAMAYHGTYLVPIMTHCVRNTNEIKSKLSKDHWVDNLILDAYESMYRVIPKAFEFGVKIALGTDAGADLVPHGSNALELELLTTIGMSPMQSIVAAIKTNSELLGIADKRGTLEKGKFADLLVVRGDPLKDIRLLQDQDNVLTVFKEGNIVVDRRENSNIPGLDPS